MSTDSLRFAALIDWRATWPDALHVERKYDPVYIAQREAFITGYIVAASKPRISSSTNPNKEAP